MGQEGEEEEEEEQSASSYKLIKAAVPSSRSSNADAQFTFQRSLVGQRGRARKSERESRCVWWRRRRRRRSHDEKVEQEAWSWLAV